MPEGNIPEVPVFQASIPATPFTKLTTNNYFSWSIKMEMLLRSQGLWQIVNPLPPDVFSAEDRSRDQRAVATIILSMEDSLLVHVRSSGTSHEHWEVVKAVFI